MSKDMIDPKVGDILAQRYRLLELVHQGGEARLFKAERLEDQVTVALKVPAAGMAGADALEREYQALVSLAHISAVVNALEFRRSGAQAWLALDWVEGLNGKQYIEAHAPLTLETWLWIARSLISALLHCHRLGVLHRDIKPHNLLIEEGKRLLLVDFGIAQNEGYVVFDGQQKGTLSYMPPEQLTDGRVHPSGEVYSVGVTLYEFLTGRPPFPGDDPGEIQAKKSAGKFLPAGHFNPNVPAWVDGFFSQLLQPDPSARPGGMHELLSMLSHQQGVSWNERGQLRACKACSAQLWPQLPFCSRCGEIFKIRPEKGLCSLLLWELKDKDRFIAKVEEAAGKPLPILHRYLVQKTLPRVLTRGLSEASARLMVRFLNDDNARVHLTHGFGDRLKSTTLSFSQSFIALASLVLALLALRFQTPVKELLLLLMSANIGLIFYTVFGHILPLNFFLPTANARRWPVLDQAAEYLRALKEDGTRDQASLLVRRVKLLYDALEEAPLSPHQKQEVSRKLGEVLLHAMTLLLGLEEDQGGLRELQKLGIAKKKKALNEQLHRERDPSLVARYLTRLQELEKREAAIAAASARVLKKETICANILSSINAVFLDFRVSGTTDLTAFEPLLQD